MFYFATINEAIGLSQIYTKKFKAMGFKKGMPDLCIPSLKLFIEFKGTKGKPTPDQIKVINNLRKNGCIAYICRSIEAFIELFENFNTSIGANHGK